jgi:hypothetical protein
MERQEWEEIPADPDLRADLGYDLHELDVLQAAGSTQYMILPHDESMIQDETFIAIDESGVCDVVDWI